MAVSDWYSHTTFPATGAVLSSSAMRSELEAVETGISAKLPDLTSNGSKLVAINSGATALEAITTTGTGSGVRATSPTLVTPLLGTPTSGTLTNCTGLPVATGISGLGAGVATFLATPSSANLASAVTGETGSGALVFGTGPSISGPTISGSSVISDTLTLSAATNVTGAMAFSGGGGYIKGNATSGGLLINNAADTINIVKFEDAGSTRLFGTLKFDTDNTYDIGASGATRPRDFFLGRNATVGGTLNAGATTIAAINVPFTVNSTNSNSNKLGFQDNGVAKSYLGATATNLLTVADSGGTDIYAFTANRLTIPGQILFPATQNASADANTLDDYEEGTFTPAVTFGGAAVGLTYDFQNGTYTKVGNAVHVRMRVVMSSKGSSTGTMEITGLPFAANSTAQTFGTLAIRGNALTGISGHLQVLTTPGASTLQVEFLGTGTFTTVTDVHCGVSSQFIISGTYFV